MLHTDTILLAEGHVPRYCSVCLSHLRSSQSGSGTHFVMCAQESYSMPTRLSARCSTVHCKISTLTRPALQCSQSIHEYRGSASSWGVSMECATYQDGLDSTIRHRGRKSSWSVAMTSSTIQQGLDIMTRNSLSAAMALRFRGSRLFAERSTLTCWTWLFLRDQLFVSLRSRLCPDLYHRLDFFNFADIQHGFACIQAVVLVGFVQESS